MHVIATQDEYDQLVSERKSLEQQYHTAMANFLAEQHLVRYRKRLSELTDSIKEFELRLADAPNLLAKGDLQLIMDTLSWGPVNDETSKLYAKIEMLHKSFDQISLTHPQLLAEHSA